MKTVIYYLILVVLVIVAMVATSFIMGELIGYDSVVVKGSVAGAGLSVIYGRKEIFGWLDKKFNI